MRNVVRNLLCGLVVLMTSGLAVAQEGASEESVFRAPIRYTTSKIENILRLRHNSHRWEHIVRGFRKEHHFALTASLGSGEWHLDRIAELVNSRHRSSSVGSGFRYSFHIPLYKSFGYFLGTETGYQIERDVDPDINPPEVTKFPGIIAGFVYNFSPVLRLRAGMSLYLERWDDFKLKHAVNEPSFSVTTRVLKGLVGLDVFYNLYWGVSVEYQTSKNHFLRPEDATNFLVDADIAKKDSQIAVNLTYHLM